MPRPPRFFISPGQVAGNEIKVTGSDVHHIRSVLRMRIGDGLVLLDNTGMEYAVRITGISGREIATEIVSEGMKRVPLPRVTLCQGIPKSDKMDLIIQKAVELGVSRIVPLVTERSIVRHSYAAVRMERWKRIAREAAMQSSRPDIPSIDPVCGFKEFIGSLPQHDDELGGGHLYLFPWEEAAVPIKDVLRPRADAGEILVAVGPEGGFSNPEAEYAAGLGFHLVSLGPLILRTETAAISVLSMILYEACQPVFCLTPKRERC